jgi:hypothetical protein
LGVCWFVVLRTTGVTTEGALGAATFGVRGGRFAARAAAALSWGWRGLSRGGGILMVERVAVRDRTFWLRSLGLRAVPRTESAPVENLVEEEEDDKVERVDFGLVGGGGGLLLLLLIVDVVVVVVVRYLGAPTVLGGGGAWV